jgi:hypothetical protein
MVWPLVVGVSLIALYPTQRSSARPSESDFWRDKVAGSGTTEAELVGVRGKQ